MSHPSCQVGLLTNDFGPQLRARSLAIRVIELPDDFSLPSVPDEAQREILRLQRELAEAKGRSPALKMLFADGTETAMATLQQPQLPNDMAIEAEIESLLVEYRKQLLPPAPITPALDPKSDLRPLMEAVAKLSTIPHQEFTRYQTELDGFPERYRAYARQRNVVENRVRRTIRLYFSLRNDGSAIAEDIILVLQVPDKLYWRTSYGEEDMPKPPPRPKPPTSPMQSLVLPLQSTGPPPSLQRLQPNASAPAVARIRGPFLDATTATWEIENLHHKSYWPLGPLYAAFRDSEEVSNFDIAYTIRERNTPDMILGKLLIRVDQSPAT